MIIDAHAHCGIQYKFPPQGFEDYLLYIEGSDINGVVVFPPVMEIYDRNAPDFYDTPEWQKRRENANEYLLTIGKQDFEVIPYFFIWNDFTIEQLKPQHKGIKWHRHSGEPVYHYDDPRCSIAIEEIKHRNMPIVLEEEFNNTLRFINEIAQGAKIIIPHLGYLNGGYERIGDYGIWEKSNIYADTALASPSEISDYINRYGYDRLMFGSDFPFGDPKEELEKIINLNISQEKKDLILSLNLRRLLADSNIEVA
jgi:hypothetical protein